MSRLTKVVTSQDLDPGKKQPKQGLPGGSGIVSDEEKGPRYMTKEAAVELKTDEMVNQELYDAHWRLHELYQRERDSSPAEESENLQTIEQIVEIHARVVDELYDRGLVHPPPPDAGLDQASNGLEKYARHQPKWFDPAPKWSQPSTKAEPTRKVYNVEASGQALDILEKVMLAMSMLGSWGASRTLRIGFDGDGADKLKVAELEGFTLEDFNTAIGKDEVNVWPLKPVRDRRKSMRELRVSKRARDCLPALCGVCKYAPAEVDAWFTDQPDVAASLCLRCLDPWPSAGVDGEVIPVLKHAVVGALSGEEGYSFAIMEPEETKEASEPAEETVQKGDSVELYMPILKIDEERRLMTGVVLEPDEVDAQNDTIYPHIIEEAAFDFLSNFGRTGGTRMGLMHKRFGDVGIELVESWIAREDLIINNEKVKKGSWLMTVRAVDEALWSRVKRKELTGFSIGGVAVMS